MADYWVSVGNYWCQFCKKYIRNTPVSRRHHETGNTHKSNVQKFLREMRDKDQQTQRESSQAKRELANLYKVARNSDAEDQLIRQQVAQYSTYAQPGAAAVAPRTQSASASSKSTSYSTGQTQSSASTASQTQQYGQYDYSQYAQYAAYYGQAAGQPYAQYPGYGQYAQYPGYGQYPQYPGYAQQYAQYYAQAQSQLAQDAQSTQQTDEQASSEK